MSATELAVPAEYRPALDGDPGLVAELLERFTKLPEHDPQRAWIALVFRAPLARAAARNALREVDAWHARLLEAAGHLLRLGGAVAFPTNIRAGRDGYNWGPPAVSSSILRHLGRPLDFAPSEPVSERWYNSDDPRHSTVLDVNGTPLPLFWLVDHFPEAALGTRHVRDFGPSLGMVMKDLEAAESLSWQLHVGVEEGYEVLRMPRGTGLFGCLNEGADLDRVRTLLARRDRRVIRLEAPSPGVETPPLLNAGLDALLSHLLSRVAEMQSVASVVETLMLEGLNVVDLAGFGVDDNGQLAPSLGLVGIHQPRVGERVVMREGRSHALFGNVRGAGSDAVGWFREFKGTATGPRGATVATGDQTWSLSDVFLGRHPRPGKVTRRRVEEALAVMKRGNAWRALVPEDFQARGDPDLREVADGVAWQRLHEEQQFSALRTVLAPGRSACLRRHGRHSALVVTGGVVDVCAAQRGNLIATLGLHGAVSDEGFVCADQGDLVLHSRGAEQACVYDAIRPVEGVPLPNVAVIGG